MVISKQLSVGFLFPSIIAKKSLIFSTVRDSTEIFIINDSMQFCKLEGIYQNIFVDRWLEFLDIKLNKLAIFFIGNINKQFQN